MAEASASNDELEALVGQVFDGRYRIDALLGAGGMGAVFRAHHTGLGQDVAVKVLRPDVGGGKTATARFEREAKSASRLDHPNCVRVTDFGALEDGSKYLVMQLLSGSELKDRMGAPWSPLAAVDTTLQILDGLEHAHANGIVHRDLKPENVYLTTDHRGQSQIKLVDFGIAKIVEGEGADDKLTRTGMIFGTPRYMSPEQAAGGKVDARTDLYAVGLILYELLAGKPPFVAEETAMLLRMHILQPPPPLPDTIPASVSAVVMKLLEKSRMDRFDDATSAIAALRAAREDVAAGAGPAQAGAVAAAAVGGAAAGVSGSMPGAATGVSEAATRASGMHQPPSGVPPEVMAQLTAEVPAPGGQATAAPTTQLPAGYVPGQGMAPAQSMPGNNAYSASAMTVPTGAIPPGGTHPGGPGVPTGSGMSGSYSGMPVPTGPYPVPAPQQPARGNALPWAIAGGAVMLLGLTVFGVVELGHLRGEAASEQADAASGEAVEAVAGAGEGGTEAAEAIEDGGDAEARDAAAADEAKNTADEQKAAEKQRQAEKKAADKKRKEDEKAEDKRQKDAEKAAMEAAEDVADGLGISFTAGGKGKGKGRGKKKKKK